MKTPTSKRVARPLVAILCLVCVSLCAHAQAAGSNWRRVRTENFVVVSNASDAEARRAATHLEELRAIFGRLRGHDSFDVAIPVTVILFQNDGDYEFFKPTYRGDLRREVAGYFLYSPDINYITLSLETGRGRDPHSVLFHEYVHALVRNNYAGAPLWLNEGMAQYYSEFELSKDRRRVTLGRQLTYRLDALLREEFLPLDTLFSVEASSTHYQQHDRHQVFYAQSWALVHYLLNDATGTRPSQLARYLELLGAGKTVAESFREAFKVDFGQMESELRAYVRTARYGERRETFAEPVPPAATAESRALTGAEVQATLGDLLLRADRMEDAEEYLTRALKWDANLASAHSSLGLLRLKQNRLSEAREYLERAVSGDPENYLAHYYYAGLLRREGLETELTVTGYAATTRLIRAALKRVIELAPNFLEAYALLALVDIERNPQVDETFALLNRALALAPKRQEFNLLLAQLHLRLESFARARQILEPLAQDPRLTRTRAEAQALLERVAANEALAALQRKAQRIETDDATTTTSVVTSSSGSTGEAKPEGDASAAAATPPAVAEALPCDMPQPGPQFKPLRFEGQQACGQLVSVECEDAGGVTLLIETAERTLKLRSHALNRIRFVSYTADVRGRVECGLRTRANPVLVTYRLPKDARTAAAVDGEVLAVEFVPSDWVH